MTKTHNNCIFMQINYNGDRYCSLYHLPLEPKDNYFCEQWQGKDKQ